MCLYNVSDNPIYKIANISASINPESVLILTLPPITTSRLINSGGIARSSAQSALTSDGAIDTCVEDVQGALNGEGEGNDGGVTD